MTRNSCQDEAVLRCIRLPVNETIFTRLYEAYSAGRSRDVAWDRSAFAKASDFVPIHYIGTTPDPHQRNVRAGKTADRSAAKVGKLPQRPYQRGYHKIPQEDN